MSDKIQPIKMPKWGLAMTEGLIANWHVEEGTTIAPGDEIAEIETTKITNVFESPVGGVLRRRLTSEGETVPVGALLAVTADPSVPDADIDAFVQDFEASFDATATAEADQAEPEFVEAGGYRLRYLRMGEDEGVPLVLVHGFGGDLNSWMFNQPGLASSRTVYALDLPGHGASSKNIDAGDVQAMASTVRDFLAAIAIDTAHFVGHSLGGAIVVDLASRERNPATSVTLLCSAGLGADINMSYIDGFIAADRRKEIKPVLEMLFGQPDLVSRDIINDVLKFKRLDGVAAALSKIAGAAFADGRQALVLRDRLAGLDARVQIIWGGEDQILPPSHAEGLPQRVAVHVLDGAGHMVHMEKPGEVNALIETFVAG